ncbi:hypothetical protein CDAR_517681 [Caerostris darwini]|uniref:Uncharacterized protein n=1 Tax=Caerostris darwini TaxID=1538125 RepID=A0AAV4SBS1_9ARAC|nr:hypothetical protein CDAR_517681 [Caerostris darwini]
MQRFKLVPAYKLHASVIPGPRMGCLLHLSSGTYIRVIDELISFQRKVSDFWRAKNYLIPHRHPIGSSNLSPESLPNHHLTYQEDTFPEKPSTLSQT